MDQNPPERITLTLADWVAQATAVLVDEGVDRVRVDVLARALGVTRGSFYWHFKDRADLLQRMLDAWRQAATDQIIERFSREADPQRQLQDLLSLPFRGRSAERAARVELAIRDWARRDSLARHALDDVDARRISYIAQCFSALGFGIAEARARAFLLYGWEVSESLMPRQGTAAQKQERSALLSRMLLTPQSQLQGASDPDRPAAPLPPALS
jgi:AcrR family transcriptional regulator